MKKFKLATEEIQAEVEAELAEWIENKGLLMFNDAASAAKGAVKEFVANSKGYTYFPMKVK